MTRRTTILLDAALYRDLKRTAVERDTTLRGVLEKAIREFLARSGVPRAQGVVKHGVYDFGFKPGELRRENIYRKDW